MSYLCALTNILVYYFVAAAFDEITTDVPISYPRTCRAQVRRLHFQ